FFAQAVQQAQASVTLKAESAGPLAGANMPKLMKALLAHGADPNAAIAQVPDRLRKGGRAYVSMIGATPFLLAAASSDLDRMRTLVESHATVKVTTRVDEKDIPVGVYSDEAQFQGSATPLLAAAGLGRARTRRGEAAKKALETVKLLIDLG